MNPSEADFAEAIVFKQKYLALVESTFGMIGEEWWMTFDTFAEFEGIAPFDIIGIWSVADRRCLLRKPS